MPPPGDAVTETGLAALLLAMTKMNVACVVRFVKRKNAVPELGCLFASDPADFAGSGRQISLIYTKLPVLEDMREYSFSSFEQVFDRNLFVYIIKKITALTVITHLVATSGRWRDTQSFATSCRSRTHLSNGTASNHKHNW